MARNIPHPAGAQARAFNPVTRNISAIGGARLAGRSAPTLDTPARSCSARRAVLLRRQAMRVLENYINGVWTKSSGTTLLDVKNPATGATQAQVPLSPADDVDAA